jgi:hypothetical protein
LGADERPANAPPTKAKQVKEIARESLVDYDLYRWGKISAILTIIRVRCYRRPLRNNKPRKKMIFDASAIWLQADFLAGLHEFLFPACLPTTLGASV